MEFFERPLAAVLLVRPACIPRDAISEMDSLASALIKLRAIICTLLVCRVPHSTDKHWSCYMHPRKVDVPKMD